MQGLEVGGERPDEVQCYDGVFYNYFSIGTLTCKLVDDVESRWYTN